MHRAEAVGIGRAVANIHAAMERTSTSPLRLLSCLAPLVWASLSGVASAQTIELDPYARLDAAPQATVTFEAPSSSSPVVLHRVIDAQVVVSYQERMRFTERRLSYAPICRAPCTVTLPPGRYELGMSTDEGTPPAAPVATLDLTDGALLRADFVTHETERMFGVVVFGGGMLLGAGSLLGYALVNTFGVEVQSDVEMGVVVGGLTALGLALALGTPFAFWFDHQGIELITADALQPRS